MKKMMIFDKIKVKDKYENEVIVNRDRYYLEKYVTASSNKEQKEALSKMRPQFPY